jgi:glycosyltransferase involved in cell wall biosynthesis
MKVAMLTFFPHDLEVVPGGIRMVSLNLVRGLQRFEDLDLTVIHCHSDVAQDDERWLGRVRLLYLAMPKQRLVPNLVTSVGRIAQAVRQVAPDLIHAHTAHFAYAGLQTGLPTILTIHGVLSEQRKVYNRTLFDRTRYGLLAYYERRALTKVRAVTAISAYVVEAYAARGSASWTRIANPVPDAFLDLPVAPEPGRILYAGSTDERKDLLTLLAAVALVRAEVPEVRLCIAGHVTNPAYERQVHRYVREQGLEPCVEFAGLLGRDALLAQYARCSVVALASVEENAPMALIEGMATSHPVVATRVGGVPEVVHDGETGFLVPPRDPAAMAARLCELLTSPQLCATMGRQARREAAERFGLARISQAYYTLYQRIGGRS